MGEGKKKKKRDGQNVLIAILLVIVFLLGGLVFMLSGLGHLGDGGLEGYSFTQSVKNFFGGISDSSSGAIDSISRIFSGSSSNRRRAEYVFEHTDADRICFFGDSLTYGITFTDNYDKEFTNLGVVGDSISALISRVWQVKQANPEKIFLLCGINSLRDNNVEAEYQKYATLLSDLREACPDALIYVQSVLPVSAYQESYICRNSTIVDFNLRIRILAEENGMKYVDLYSLFELNGVMNPDYTSDGVHLTGAGYRVWEEAIAKYIK